MLITAFNMGLVIEDLTVRQQIKSPGSRSKPSVTTVVTRDELQQKLNISVSRFMQQKFV
jgi:hypothetical protein